jgi:uncharacterized protein YbbC (DUF1343 family)
VAVHSGLETFVRSPEKAASPGRWGLLCNPASVDASLRHARLAIENRFPRRLTALFSPQHGFFAEKQDNMIESGHRTDPVLKLPVFSLYGDTRYPTEEMFDLIDTLIIDLQDVGTRVYTFIYTLSYSMEAARRFGKKVIVLDRPNPIGGETVEGNMLKPAFASFVGRYPIPMRHGMTIGELALLFNRHFGIGCDLQVVPLQNWRRRMYFNETGLPWVAPSPNLPTPTSAMVYPGQVIWEGTNISEGRGTTQPFELFGAPFIDTERLLETIGGRRPPGVILRPAAFEPTANKWMGRLCRGFQIHLQDQRLYRPYVTSLKLLKAVRCLYPDRLEWKKPPYEYEYEKVPFDLITGDPLVRKAIEGGEDIDQQAAGWQADIDRFRELREAYRLYD